MKKSEKKFQEKIINKYSKKEEKTQSYPLTSIPFESEDIVRDEMVTKIINAYDDHDECIKDLLDTSS